MGSNNNTSETSPPKMEEDLPEQLADEITVLESMYPPDCLQFSRHSRLGLLKVNISLPPNYYIRTLQEKIRIKHLPPLQLYFQLVPGYPDRPPGFCLTCHWLTHLQLSKLCKELDRKWKTGEVIIYEWGSWLSNETLSHLGLQHCLDLSDLSKMKEQLQNGLSDSSSTDNLGAGKQHMFPLPTSRGPLPLDMRAMTDIVLGIPLKKFLCDYSDTAELEIFNKSLFDCSICLETKKGLHFLKFDSCGHLFCRDCCKAYLETHIREANVRNLTCLASDCDSTFDHNRISELVEDTMFDHYDKLLLKQTLEAMKDIVMCPRKSCAIPMIVDENTSMATCPNCDGTFCLLCKRTYHGLEPCSINPFEKQKMAKLYQNGTDEERAMLERTYGRRTLKALVEECLSEAFISENSKKCPKCSTNIIKEDGCHKMWCSKCQTHFCWLCMAVLDSNNPYRHFSDMGGTCFNRLFLGMHMEEEQEDEDDFNFGQFL